MSAPVLLMQYLIPMPVELSVVPAPTLGLTTEYAGRTGLPEERLKEVIGAFNDVASALLNTDNLTGTFLLTLPSFTSKVIQPLMKVT